MDPQEQRRRQNMQAARQRIGQESRKSLYLAGLIATLPAYLAYRLVHGHFSNGTELTIVTLTYSSIAAILTRLFKRWAAKHPGSAWRNFID